MQAAFFFLLTHLLPVPIYAQSEQQLAEESHQAKQLMAQQRFAEAIPLYEKLVKAVPGNPGLLLNLALAEEMAGQPARAIPNFEAVLKIQPQNPPALVSLAMAHLQLNQAKAAMPILRRLLNVDPKNINAIGMLAEAESNEHEYAQSAAHYRELTVMDAADARAWYGLGKAYESMATQAFDRLDKLAPQSGYVAALLADTRFERRQYRSAFFFYREAQSKLPNLPGVHSGLAMVYRETKHPDWSATEEQDEKAMAAPDCNKQVVECAFVSGRYGEAARAAEAKNDADSLFWATKAYNQLAIEAFDKLSQLPESVQLHAFKAQTFHDHKRDLEAAEEWKAAARLAPGDVKVKQELAAALFDAKAYQEDMPLLEDLLRSHPNSSELNYYMGASLFRTEQPQKAIQYLEQSVKSPIDTPAADAALGLALEAVGKNAEAIPYLKKAQTIDDDGSLHYSLARAYRAVGDTARSSEAMRQYQQIQARNQQINDQLSKEAEITGPTQ